MKHLKRVNIFLFYFYLEKYVALTMMMTSATIIGKADAKSCVKKYARANIRITHSCAQ